MAFRLLAVLLNDQDTKVVIFRSEVTTTFAGLGAGLGTTATVIGATTTLGAGTGRVGNLFPSFPIKTLSTHPDLWVAILVGRAFRIGGRTIWATIKWDDGEITTRDTRTSKRASSRTARPSTATRAISITRTEIRARNSSIYNIVQDGNEECNNRENKSKHDNLEDKSQLKGTCQSRKRRG